jgi:hypothetical protein
VAPLLPTSDDQWLALPIPSAGTTLGDYFMEPLLGMLAVGLLALVLRWSHQPPKIDRARSRGAAVGEHGMLVPVVSVPDEGQAREKARQLAAIGIRATVSPTRAEHLVLVWPWEAQAARDCLARRSGR